ncbi:hypothetical protein OEA41_004211 [Lepraria neglecta]|uniref:Carrier domain-containing protein n=1 Tax=Lepraria neglecta TaxID=209136 RepID=A0AAD9Z601_9LECA|nr:hypothetical protein OEA41_004211 [Lepraria neglecta]
MQHFNTPLRSKVQGTQNLHTCLPKGMDFFILLSSTSAVIGNRGQSNYAAACAYQDAFARYRVSLGEKCVSLNLGMVTGVGIVAEQRQLGEALEAAGYQGIQESELLAMLDCFCDPTFGVASSFGSQIVTGLVTPQSVKSKGLEEIFWMRKPLFRNLHQIDQTKEDPTQKTEVTISYAALLNSVGSRQAAATIITQALIKKLSKTLSSPEENIDPNKPLESFGVDSLVAVEIRSWLSKEIKADVAVFDILASDSISALCLLAAGKSSCIQTIEDTK